MSALEIWTYRSRSHEQHDLTGMSVEALDGAVGTVESMTNDLGASYIVIDTGPWIFSKKVLLPAGVIRQVDLGAKTILVDRTKEQIRNAPEYDEQQMRDPGWRDLYQSQIESYYGPNRRR
jgi:PRC-barrel domain